MEKQNKNIKYLKTITSSTNDHWAMLNFSFRKEDMTSTINIWKQVCIFITISLSIRTFQICSLTFLWGQITSFSPFTSLSFVFTCIHYSFMLWNWTMQNHNFILFNLRTELNLVLCSNQEHTSLSIACFDKIYPKELRILFGILAKTILHTSSTLIIDKRPW